MIYVHAKGMIVDDEYVIVGSANINQRSIAGTKDTEIAMGAYQPHHTWAAKKSHPRGQVCVAFLPQCGKFYCASFLVVAQEVVGIIVIQIYGYRMSLWMEHLDKKHEVFMEPQSLECVKTVNSIAEENWKKYTDSVFTSLQGHLLRYPVLVDADGKIGPLPGHEHFPDVGGKVVGAHSFQLPDMLTT
uniref:phospholipase D n=1 Tax=Rhizophora mucronata TaxID=61149 RepID=A0A2P2JNE0_RHIMU